MSKLEVEQIKGQCESALAAGEPEIAWSTVYDALRRLTRARDEERVLLSKAARVLSECGQDYNNPHFTDRHGTGSRITEVLKSISALAAGDGDG